MPFFIFIIIWLILFFTPIVQNAIRKNKHNIRQDNKINKVGVVSATPKQIKDIRPSNTQKTKQPQTRLSENRIQLIKNFEDRNNDWLSKQRKEELSITERLWGMFGIRTPYMMSNDARKLRQEHINEHEEHVVDKGSGI